MHGKFLNRFSQCIFAEQDHPIKARFLYSPHKSLRVGVGMSLQVRRMAILKVDVSE